MTREIEQGNVIYGNLTASQIDSLPFGQYQGYINGTDIVRGIANDYVSIHTLPATTTRATKLQTIESGQGVRYTRKYNGSSWSDWHVASPAYTEASSSATCATFLSNAGWYQGLNPGDKVHTGLITVTTSTDNEYLLAFFLYKHNSIGRGISISNNVISLSAINNIGTVAVTGGTAPYNFSVIFFT